MALGRIYRFLTARRTAGSPLSVLAGTAKAFAAAHLFCEYAYDFGPAKGASMLPTFNIVGDHLLVSKHYRRGRDVRVGDVVYYDIPLFRHAVGVKRVLGLPGDYVLLGTPGTANEQMIQVPKGHCWVVGDNLEASRDSRTFGPLPLGLVRGKVIARFWPFSEARWVGNGFDEGRSAAATT